MNAVAKYEQPIDAATLRSYVSTGMTLEEMSQAWLAQTGQRRSRAAFGLAMSRHGIENPRAHARYVEQIPWRVAEEHQMGYDARMLRLLGKRQMGVELGAGDARRLDAWLKALDEDGAVVHYDRQTVQGWWHVERVPADGDGYIRKPEAGN